MLIDFGRQPVRQRIALRGVQWHQEFSDLRIGVQLGERPAVGGAPLPQQQRGVSISKTGTCGIPWVRGPEQPEPIAPYTLQRILP